MTTEIIGYNMFNGEKKTEITKEESANVESVTIRRTLDKEEIKEFTVIPEHFNNNDYKSIVNRTDEIVWCGLNDIFITNNKRSTE